MGINPVVYYSTAPNLQLAQMDSGAEEGTAAPQANLKDPSIWSTTAPQDLSKVTAIAIDCSKKANGTPFVLEAGQSIPATLSMRAPSNVSAAGRAYNDAYFVSQTKNAGHVQNPKMTHKGHTEVALKPYKLHVTNSWNDDNDRDGKRPQGTVVLHLMANGSPAKDSEGKDVTFEIASSAVDGYTMSPDSAETTFDGLPVADASGNPIHYTATLADEKGNPISGYTQSVKYGKDEHGNEELDLVQNYVPETTSVSGTKTWAGDTEDIRPVAISINLLADGTQTQSKQITENASGDWTYSFTNLPKYENHGKKEIDYKVSESGADDYALARTPTSAGYDLANTYHPYGDLTISKTVTDGTNKTEGQKFTFHLSLTKQDGSDYTDAVSYDKYGKTVKTGTIASGSTFQLAAGESFVLKNLPKGTGWKVSEDSASGYTADATEKSGSIKPNAANTAAFTNDYKTSADVSLQATKTLDGRPIQYGQFTFELRNKTDGSLVRTASNDEKGNVSFGAIHYTNADSGKTFTYTITEKNLGHGGYTYDNTAYEADVKLIDNGDGTMGTTVEYYKLNKDGSHGDNVDMPAFANTYRAAGSVTLTAYKQLKGGELKENEFTFDLHDGKTGQVIATAQNDVSGKIDFKPDAVAAYIESHGIQGVQDLSYNENDRNVTYAYYVTEEKGTEDTVKYSNKVFAWTVAVQDDGDGHMSEATANVDASSLLQDCATCKGTGKIAADNGIECSACNGSGKDVNAVNPDWTATATATLPLFTNILKDGSLSIEKRAENAPKDDQTPFTFDVDIQDADGRPLSSDSGVEYEITDVPRDDSGTGSAANSSVASPADPNPVSTALNSLGSLLQPTKAYAAENTDDSDKTYTITYDANGGHFSDETKQHEVKYTGHPATATKYSHTANIDDNGNANGYYANNLSTTDTVTIPGAKQLYIDVWYSTESTSYDWLAIYPEGVTPSGSNYSSAIISGGKLGGGRSATKDNATHKRFTVDGDTAQFYFRSDSSTAYYGYYAVVTDGSVQVTGESSYEEPIGRDEKVFKGWCKDAELSENLIDPSTLGEDATVYAKYEYVHEGTWGTCKWGISTSGTLYIGAGTGADTKGTCPWSEYVWSIKSVKTLGTVVLPSDSRGLFYFLTSLESLDLRGFDTSKVTNMRSMFDECHSPESLDISGFDTSKVTFVYRIFDGCYGLKRLVISDKMWHLGGTLPGIPKTDLYTGKWMNAGNSSIKLSSWDLMTGAPAGIWEWEKVNPVKVSFDANHGDGKMKSYIVNYDIVQLPENGFYRQGFDFVGWSTDKSGTVKYKPGDIFDTQGKDTVLYAQWTKSDNKAQVTNGHFTVTIMAGQKITIKNLPGGATYTVHEHNRAGWVLTSAENATGKIFANDIPKSAKSVFTNTYNPEATSVDISATKTLDGKTPKDGAYSFTMTANTLGAPMPAGATGTSTTASNVGTLVDFGHIVFRKPGTYFYTLKETAGTDSTISYDAHTIKARVDVSDPTGTGALVARVTYSPNDAFVNSTKPGTLTVTKNVTGTSDTEKSFSFAVTLADSNHQPLSGTYGGVAVTGGTGTFTLKAGESKQLANLPAGTLYQVEETDVPDGYTSSSTGATGTIAAAGASTATFTNTYAASATSVYLTAQKTLTGRQLQDQEFAFELKDAGGKKVQNATNDADGSIFFNAISFDSAGDYKYYVDEVKPGNPDQTISYADEVYEYDIQVTDNGAGELQNSVSIYAVDSSTHERKGDKIGTASFTNAVKTGSVSLTKRVEGSDAKDKEFVFDVALKDSAGKALDGEYAWTSSRNDLHGSAIKGTVKNGGTLSLQKDEMVTISSFLQGAHTSSTRRMLKDIHRARART